MKRRIFTAVDMPEGVKALVGAHVSRLRSDHPEAPVRWERPEKLHLTLNFAGELDEEDLTHYAAAVRKAASSAAPFTIAIGGTGTFRQGRDAAVLWLGVVDQTGGLTRLANAVGVMTGRGDDRPYKPHLTIARTKDRRSAVSLIRSHLDEGFPVIQASVDALVVYESRLQPGGSVYSVVASEPLGRD